MYSRLSFGAIIQMKKLLNDFKTNHIFEGFQFECTLYIENKKEKYNMATINVYDGWDYYDLLVKNDSDYLLAENSIKITRLSIARINKIDYELIVTDYEIIKSRKRKAKDNTASCKKQKLDNKNYYTDLVDIVDYRLNNENLHKKSYVNVIGIIVSIEDIKKMKIKKFNEETGLLNFRIMDEKGYSVRCAIWGINALFFQYQYRVGEIIFMKNIQLDSFNGITLSCIYKTRIIEMKENENMKTEILNYYYLHHYRRVDEEKALNNIYFSKICK